MAKAKKIRRDTDKAAKKELKKSGALKGLSRKEKKRKIYVAGLKKRNEKREGMAQKRRLKIEQAQKEADVERNKARAKGQKLVYDRPTVPTANTGISKGQADEARRVQKNNERIRQNQQAMKDAGGGAYQKTMQDGSVRNVVSKMKGESDADFRKRVAEIKKSRSAKHGGALAIMIAPVKSKKMKAVKKAPGGASMKKMPSYKKGGALKAVPSDAKGLSKLPTSVRNKMGYAKHGGKVKYQEGGKVGDPKKKKSVVTVDQDLKDLGNALKEGVKMITIPGYGAMKLSQYLAKRKQGVSKTNIIKQAKAEGLAETAKEMAEMGNMKRMVEKPTMKTTMTKLVKKKDKKISLPKKTVSKIDPPKEIKLKGGKMMYGGSMKKAMYGAKMKKKAMYGAKMKK